MPGSVVIGMPVKASGDREVGGVNGAHVLLSTPVVDPVKGVATLWKPSLPGWATCCIRAQFEWLVLPELRPDDR